MPSSQQALTTGLPEYRRLPQTTTDDFKDDRLNFKMCKPLELDVKFKLAG